ncbi:MAG TPA: mercury(II) reductase, partial [Deltaproteobacteria bacterium]|nr:mercury(II) reductase [Deltaproteobacteria bacterium]
QRAWKNRGRKIISFTVGGKEDQVSGDEILLATGKTPNTAGLALEAAGVTIDERRAIVVNDFLQTSQPHIFAAGDVINLPLRYEITAGHEGTLAADNALNGSQESIDYDSVPYTIFTDPQLAGVGLTEEEQMKRFGTCLCQTVPFTSVPKAIIMKRTEGLIKMAINPETHQIMGVHILAPYAGDLIAEAMILVKNKNTIDDVVETLPMFPTLSEAIKLVAMSFIKDVTKLSCCV